MRRIRCSLAIGYAILLFLAVGSASLFAGGTPPSFKDSGLVPVDVSKDLKLILFTNPINHGLQLLDTDSGESAVISDCPATGNYATISPDKKYVCFKNFVQIDGSVLQVPSLYDIAAGKLVELSPAVELAGTPAVSSDGKIAFTVGNQLFVKGPDGQTIKTVDLGQHVNLLAFSPDGASLAFSNEDQQIVQLGLSTGFKRQLTGGRGMYWNPKYSPLGDKIVASTVAGEVACLSTGRRSLQIVGKGVNPSWADNDTIVFTEKKLDGYKVQQSELVAVKGPRAFKRSVYAEPGDASFVVESGSVAASAGADLKFGIVQPAGAQMSALSASAKLPALGKMESVDSGRRALVVDTGNTIELSGVPYLHQCYDTADWFDGNWACGASSALMCIQYYNKLPAHPMTCSTPSSHTHNFGWYVSENYTFNGHTYNIGSADPDGDTAYGGYGYITQGNWEDTKGHMAEYISYHGPTSGVDWSPTWAEAQAEINADHPFVVLTSLTSSGHYIACIGYFKAQHTLVFNDPYGNKNSGYMNYSGTRVFYDWPGYNNGYSNLNTVHCFIYARATQSNPKPNAPSNLAATAASKSQINLTWTDNSGVETNFVVARSTTAGGPYTDIATLGANVTSYSNTGLSANTRYYYVVRAKNAAGSSANSNEANALTWPADVIVDNSAAGFTASSNWLTGTSAADKYGTNYRYRSTAAVSDAAQWSFTVPQTRNYQVYAWWSAGTNRSATAPYIVTHSGGSTTVNKNQQTGGGAWQSLGTFNLNAGTNTVRLSCWTTTGYVVIADAVKIVAK